MELDKKIVYFYLKKESSAKKHFWSSVQMPCIRSDMEEYELLLYEVPEFFCGKWGKKGKSGESWKREQLLELLKEKLEEPGIVDYYLQPALSKMMEIEEKLPPEILLRQVMKQNLCWEYLFVIGSEDQADGCEAEEQKRLLFTLLQEYFLRINHLTVVTDNPRIYAEIADYVYEEYGIPTAYASKLEKRIGKSKKTTVLDIRHCYLPPYASIPTEATYIDFWSEEEKRERLQMKRRDVRYLSTVKFLDTLAKNGYNTRVNQTHKQKEKK